MTTEEKAITACREILKAYANLKAQADEGYCRQPSRQMDDAAELAREVVRLADAELAQKARCEHLRRRGESLGEAFRDLTGDEKGGA